MTKLEFLSALEARLAGIPQEDVDKSVEFYTEMIADRMDEGLTEEEAVASIGTVEEIVAQILAEIPLTKLVGHKLKPKRALRGWEIALLILGIPVWLPLLATAACLLLTGMILFWSLVLLLYAGDFALAAVGVAGVLSSPVQMFTAGVEGGLLLLGCGLLAAGASIFLFHLATFVFKCFLRVSKSIVLAVKRSFIKKGGRKV